MDTGVATRDRADSRSNGFTRDASRTSGADGAVPSGDLGLLPLMLAAVFIVCAKAVVGGAEFVESRQRQMRESEHPDYDAQSPATAASTAGPAHRALPLRGDQGDAGDDARDGQVVIFDSWLRRKHRDAQLGPESARRCGQEAGDV